MNSLFPHECSNPPPGFLTCFLSAFFGCIGSILGKLGFDDKFTLAIAQVLASLIMTVCRVEAPNVAYYITKTALIGLMLFMNSMYVVKSMSVLGSTSASTIVTSFSFTLSGIIGLLFFQEDVPLQWWIGVVVILAGVVFVSLGTEEDPYKLN